MKAKVDFPGVNRVRAKGRVYFYLGRGSGAVRLQGEPGSPEFMASYLEAKAHMRTPDKSRFRYVVTAYKRSPDYGELADTTKAAWAPWLDRISEHFGDLRIAQFDRPEKIRPIIRKWRNKYRNTPRAADMGLQVLSRVCSYMVDPLGKIATNPCEGVKHLYKADRSEIIWTDADIDRVKKRCSPEVARAVDLASYTGLRVSDLLRLSWNHVHDAEDAGYIAMATSKSRGRREAIIPLYDDLRAVLADIPKRSPTILTNTRGRPWTRDGFNSSFYKAKIAAGMGGENLHFHDLRGTATTRFYLAGIDKRTIAEIMGWEEEHVERIIRRYVDRSAAIKKTIVKLNQTNRGT